MSQKEIPGYPGFFCTPEGQVFQTVKVKSMFVTRPVAQDGNGFVQIGPKGNTLTAKVGALVRLTFGDQKLEVDLEITQDSVVDFTVEQDEEAE